MAEVFALLTVRCAVDYQEAEGTGRGDVTQQTGDLPDTQSSKLPPGGNSWNSIPSEAN